MLTIPNALTFLRFLGIPFFIWLAGSGNNDGWAILVLMIGGATDYFDGKLARALNQESKFGEIADPTIDRLYIAATLIVLYLRDAIPVWLIAVLVIRDLAMAILALVLQAKGLPTLTVTYLGKAATFNLLYAFPFLLLALSDSWYGTLAFIFGWAFAIWGVGLYCATAFGYFQTGLRSARVPASNRIIESL